MTSSEPKRDDIEVGNVNTESSTTVDYPHGVRLAAIVISLMLGMFLVALDNVSWTLPSTAEG